ncbi:hypothetical protein [Streptomyces tibetensis]|uniref:hypothetical protein n=1 Tax=Streptomyces tibetensis TaxID=2382123 RepID=UPI0033E92525
MAVRPPAISSGCWPRCLPPTKAAERFWSDLWRSSGAAYLLRVNIKALVLRSLAGEGTLHADRRSDHPAGRKAFLDAWTSA